MLDFVINWLASTPGFAVPYALAALGLIINEKAGVLALGAEGFMLVGAMAGVGAVVVGGGSPLLAILIAALAAAAVSLLFAILVIGMRADQVIVGLAMVFLCQGLTGLISADQGWTNRTIIGLTVWPLWPLSEIPIVGRILFQHDPIVYLTVPIFFIVHWVLARSEIGLRLRAVGENPEAADAAGVNIPLYRLCAIVVGAALVGMAGGYLSVGVSKIWVEGMSGGRGWIAIALVIFARWYPWRALLGAVLFGCIEALIPRISASGLQVPQYFVLMTPYLATIAVMIWTSLSGGARWSQPSALGRPYLREERR